METSNREIRVMNVVAPEPIVARLARFLGGGTITPYDVERAADILVLIQHPDEAMVAIGDCGVWRAMIDAALAERWHAPTALQVHGGPQEALISGADEEGDMQISDASPRLDGASWVQLRGPPGGVKGP